MKRRARRAHIKVIISKDMAVGLHRILAAESAVTEVLKEAQINAVSLQIRFEYKIDSESNCLECKRLANF